MAPFDADSATLLGSPESVLSPVGETNRGTGQYVLADNGTLIYDPPSTSGSGFFMADVVLVDRTGGIEELDAEKAAWSQPRFSPDGDRLLLRRVETPNCDLWTRNLERGTTTRITFEHDTHDPLWDPSGDNVMYAGDQGARRSVFRVAADGSSAPAVMIDADVSMYPASWSADGRRLVMGVVNQHSGDDVWVLDLDRESEPFPFLDSRFGERYPVISPDGRWIAYASDESGHWEVFVRPYPGPGGRVQVSTDGGTEPLWSPDGAGLFYRADGKIWEAGVTESSGSLRVSTPTPLFDDQFERVTGANPDQRQYDISPAGDVFAMIRPDPRANEQRPLRVVIDWLEAALESLEDE
jgi:Tol biopolymer transport system component